MKVTELDERVICGYVRMALKAGMLYTTGEKQEGFIAYKLPGQKVSLKAGLPLVKGFFSAMNLKEAFCFSILARRPSARTALSISRAFPHPNGRLHM